ncbi:hypothetical protein L596_005218 [Steinernema carpocapsae]|uniref:Uncharacterized protein n=1 Tax=Steinernema carpocapsae TaxID=34508 RepID=A0A4U8UYA7_STECR|nr:hypothetical protein L596_005218 [Steinernema carpocapsae]
MSCWSVTTTLWSLHNVELSTRTNSDPFTSGFTVVRTSNSGFQQRLVLFFDVAKCRFTSPCCSGFRSGSSKTQPVGRDEFTISCKRCFHPT